MTGVRDVRVALRAGRALDVFQCPDVRLPRLEVGVVDAGKGATGRGTKGGRDSCSDRKWHMDDGIYEGK